MSNINIVWNLGTPNKRGVYLVTVRGFNGKPHVVMWNYSTDLSKEWGGEFLYTSEDFGWFRYDEGRGDYTIIRPQEEVVAWAEMPEPYRGD